MAEVREQVTKKQYRLLTAYAADPIMNPIFAPQPGPQAAFTSSDSDIILYGGAMGGGKTYAICLEVLRNVGDPDFNCVIFRRTYSDIKKAGGLLTVTKAIFPRFGGQLNLSNYIWTFPSGATVTLGQLQHEDTKETWLGSQIVGLYFDEAVTFTETQFIYMFQRNRPASVHCKIKPYIRLTTNPNRNSWCFDWVRPWVDPTHPLYPTEPATKRYLRRFTDDVPDYIKPYVLAEDGTLVWVTEDCPRCKSMTYIPATIFDNPALLINDDSYLANLEAQGRVDRERNLNSNWLIVEDNKGMFPRGRYKLIMPDEIPKIIRWVRWWDLAASSAVDEDGNRLEWKGKDPDYTAGGLWGVTDRRLNGRRMYVLADMVRFRAPWDQVEARIKATAIADGKNVKVVIEQEPAATGKAIVAIIKKSLRGIANVRGDRATGDKITRAQPARAAHREGRLMVVAADWNEAFFLEGEDFPGEEDTMHNDQIDTMSGFVMDAEQKVSRRRRAG